MKKTLVTFLAAAVVASSYGQGTIAFANSTGPTVTYEPIPGSGTIVPVPSSANARVEFLWAPVGTLDFNLFTLIPGSAVNVGVPVAGRFSGGTRTIPAGTGFTGIAPGASVDVIIRGWFLGTGATYFEATIRGRSAIFTINTGDPTAQPVAEPPTGITSQFPGLFLGIPEPSSMAIAGLGAASLLIFRRRK